MYHMNVLADNLLKLNRLNKADYCKRTKKNYKVYLHLLFIIRAKGKCQKPPKDPHTKE